MPRRGAYRRVAKLVVSGGVGEFMRPWTEKVYGIPPEQVVGSSGVVKFKTRADGKPVLGAAKRDLHPRRCVARSHIIRKVLLRQIAILNYINPF